jgi:hypothetical protein
MNLVKAYRRRLGLEPRIPLYKGMLEIPMELLAEMLGLPREVWVGGIYYNHEYAALNIALLSRSEINNITFDVIEGAMIPKTNMRSFIEYLESDS